MVNANNYLKRSVFSSVHVYMQMYSTYALVNKTQYIFVGVLCRYNTNKYNPSLRRC